MPRSACSSKVFMKSFWVDSVRAVNRLVTESVTCQHQTPCSDRGNASKCISRSVQSSRRCGVCVSQANMLTGDIFSFCTEASEMSYA